MKFGRRGRYHRLKWPTEEILQCYMEILANDGPICSNEACAAVEWRRRINAPLWLCQFQPTFEDKTAHTAFFSLDTDVNFSATLAKWSWKYNDSVCVGSEMQHQSEILCLETLSSGGWVCGAQKGSQFWWQDIVARGLLWSGLGLICGDNLSPNFHRVNRNSCETEHNFSELSISFVLRLKALLDFVQENNRPVRPNFKGNRTLHSANIFKNYSQPLLRLSNAETNRRSVSAVRSYFLFLIQWLRVRPWVSGERDQPSG